MKKKIAWVMCTILLAGLFLAQLRRNEATIEFYGKIVDQYGNPVPQASVAIHIYQGSWRRHVNRTSNVDGLFEINKADHMRGRDLVVNAISQQGYEFKLGTSAKQYGFSPINKGQTRL